MKLTGPMEKSGAAASHEAGLLKNFVSAKGRYGAWPVTVWEIEDSSPVDRALKSKGKGVGDAGAARTSKGTEQTYKKTVGTNTDGAVTSIFPPRVAANILTFFAPAQGWVYDPFAGGGTRAIMAANAGLDYLGVEIRGEEVEHLRALAKKHKVSDQIEIIHGDSRKRNGVEKESCDFLYTCPPYWNLEQYGGPEGDISMMDYGAFLEALYGIIRNSHRILKPGATSCWVVGLHRDPAHDMELVPMNHHIALLHKTAGFHFREEVIIYRKNPIALRRVGNFERGHRLLVRMHEYCLVFTRL